MPKPSKRKAEAISFSEAKDNEDDGGAEGEGSASDDDNNNDNDCDDDDDELDNTANKTPAPSNRTPQKQKTPGSSPGMTMRSGRKKKRSKKSHAAAAAANAAGADGNVTKRAKTGQNGSANNAWKDILDEDKKDDDDDEDEEMKQNDEDDEEMEEEDEEEEQTPPGGTVKKVPPETTRKAVAEAQVTESTEEDEKGEGEGGAATATAGQTSASSVAGAASSAGAAPTNGSGNGSSSSGVLGAALGGGGGGILRLVTQTLRLPSQQTPKPPPAATASGTTPLPPPGRKLIFDTAKKSTAAAPGAGGGRNKLLMQTRQLPQTGAQNEETEGMRSVQRQHFRPRNGEDAASVGAGPQVATQPNETLDEDDMSMDAMKKDVILYTKAWFALLFLCFFVGNVANVAMSNDSLSGALGRWNVKEQGARYVEWYGLQQQPVTTDIDQSGLDTIGEEEVEDKEEESHQEEEVITQTITITDPNLLSSARAKLRAHRMNLHDIQKHEFDRKELQVGLELMEGSVEEWKGRYADLDFGSADKKEKEKEMEKGVGEDGEGGEDDVVGWIKHKIESNDVVIFSKSQCPHSQETKDLFISWQSSKKDVKISHMEVIELDLQPNNKGKEMQNELFKMTKQFTVPNVFVKGKHVGGNVQVQMAASNGELKKMLEVPRLGDEKKDKNNLDGTTATVNDALEKIGNMRTSIDARWDKLSEWKYALNDLDEVLDSLEKGESGHVDVNKAMEELSKVSLISSEAMLLDVDKINVPGEGCQGMDYPLLKQEEEVMEMEEKDQEEEVEVEIEEEVPEFEEEMVEVVGGIDMDALDYASDTPVLTEEAQTAYESLLKLAQSTSEAIFGASGPSSYANQWAEQIVQEELHKVGVGGKPPPIDEVHDPIVSEAAMASIVAPANNNDAAEYTTDDAVRDIDRALEKEDADRTGKFDYASATHGARVLRRGPYATSYSLFETLPLLNRVLAYTKLRFYGHPPETALYPTNPAHARGQCWSFANEFLGSRSRRKAGLGMTNDLVGEYATLTVSLTSAITVSEVMVEHVPPSVSSNPSTAIKEFRVLGFEDGGAFGDPWELGTFKHLIGPSYQKFSIPTVLDGQNVPKLKAISIAVDSNWGADYSCLYRVRVHGS